MEKNSIFAEEKRSFGDFGKKKVKCARPKLNRSSFVVGERRLVFDEITELWLVLRTTGDLVSGVALSESTS